MNKLLNISLIFNLLMLFGCYCTYHDNQLARARDQRYGKYIDELDLKIKNLQNELYFKK